MLENFIYTYNMDFDDFTLFLAIVFGIIYFIFGIIYSLIWKKILVRRVAKKYPDETVLFSCLTCKHIIPFFNFGIGGFFGAFILPFFLFPNLGHIKTITRGNLILHITMFIISAIYMVSLGCYTAVLTNKRMVFLAPYNTVPKLDFLLTEIKKIDFSPMKLDIILNSNELARIVPKNCAKKCHALLEKLLQNGGDS